MNAHEIALRKTAKQMGVNMKGEMHECKGCLMAKSFRVSIPKKTENRSVKRLSRVFVNFGGKRRVASVRRNKYPIIVRMIPRVMHGCISFPTLEYKVFPQRSWLFD